MFAALCENSQFYRDKLKLFIAIAPGVYFSNMKSEARFVMKNDQIMRLICGPLGTQ